MLWFNLGFSDFIKRRVCKFLLNRYLGQFFQEKLRVDQICLDLYNGKGSVSDVKLCCETINSLFEAQGWDFEITNGEIGSLAVDVPWNCLMSEDSVVEVNDLYICLRPQARTKDDGTTMLESMWSSMSSSMQLAQECLEKNEDAEFEIPSNSNLEGLEKFAQTIDNILIRVKVKLVDTTIRLEYLPTDSNSGVAIIIKIKSLGYQNEARNDTQDKDESEKSDQKTIVFSTHASHYITLDDISFYSEEFRIGNKKDDKKKRKSRHNSTKSTESSEEHNINDDNDEDDEEQSSSLDPFASAISSFSPDNEMFYSQSALSESSKTNREQEESDDEEGEEIYRSEMILMGVMNNRHEIRINMKLAENVEGPKVSLEVMLGALLIHFTPRQFHLLLLLCDILLNGETIASSDDDNNKKLLNDKLKMHSREEELKKQHVPSYSGNILNHQTWSGDDYECSSEVGAKGMHYNTLRPVGSDSFLSSNSSMSSSMQSSASQTTSHTHRHKRAIERDQNADISHYNIRIAGIYLLLLHDDILMPNMDPDNESLPLNESMVEKLRHKSEHFFNYTSNFINTCSTSDLMKIGAIFNKACDSNHLRVMLAPIILSGEDRRTEKGNRTKLNISISRAEIKENLDGLSLPILDFGRKDTTSEISKQPEISIMIEKTFYVLKSSSGRQYIAPRFNMEITLGVETETQFAFDISIFDRIHALFSSPFIFSTNSSNDQDFYDELSTKSQRLVQPKSEIKILAENLKLILFFPIVDMRPLHDKDRCPYWKRNVRSDFLQIKFKEFKMNSISSIYDIMAKEIKFYYSETEKHSPIYFAKASFYENTMNKHYQPTIEYPRIIIQMPSDSQIQELNEEFIREHHDKKDDSDSDPTSYESIKIKMNLDKDSTPFSKKRVCRESDTPHNKSDEDESEILLIPGDREEMKQFCDNAFKFSKLQVKLDLPIVMVQLKSKHFYEVFYNRIITDILMWESSVPKEQKPPEIKQKKQPESLMNAGMMDSIYAPFTMCKSNINFESGSSATNSESESETDPVFYSVYDRSSKQKSVLQDIYQTDYSNAVALELNIGQGMVTMYIPVRDSQNHVIPGQLGEFVLKTKSTSIFSVNNYHGNANLGYFCIQSENMEVYHCGLLPVPIQNPPLRDLNCALPSWLNATIYSTPRNLIHGDHKVSFERDMLSLAVQIKANPDQGIKRVKVSLGIQNATLRYFSSLSEHLWLTQVMDFFDVKEDVVPGYTPYTNLTELHLHLWNSCVDYRPKRYPFRAIVNIGALMISSNIATGSVGCTLRFVAEDGTLCLAPQVLEEKQQNCNKITSLPYTELVCVAELGLFEISLKLSDKVTPLSPKYDLRAAIRDVHVRTCSDSGRALLEFISYLASEGDLYDDNILDDNQSETSSIMQTNDDELLLKDSETDIPEVTESQQKHVNTLITDAMEESIYIPRSNTNDSGDSDEPIDLGTEVFFFPDEHSKKSDKTGSHPGPSSFRKPDSYKRRCASEDSISIDSSSYREDEEVFVRRYQPKEEDSSSVNTEMRELLNFETSVMGGLKEPEEEFDPLPQVEMDLGDINKYELPKVKPEVENKKKCSDSDDDFCFVADEERPQYSDMPVLQSDDPIRIVDNHFSAPHGKPDLLKAPADFPMAVQRYTLCEMTLVWHIYGGRDFDENDRKKEREERDEMNRRAFSNYSMSEVYKMGVSYTKGSPSLSIGTSSQNRLTWKTRGGYGRKHDVLMEIHLNKVRFSHETYPTTTEQASRQVLVITEIEIRDKLAISNINKFLYHPTVGFRTRQGNNHMVVVKALHLRPDRALKTQECCLRISLLPIRLNIDQDSLLFMINFFNELGGENDVNESKASQSLAKAHQPPVMMVELPEAAQELQARKMVSENLSLLLNDENKGSKETETSSEQPSVDSSPIFFRQVIFSPDVPIRLDYQGKRVELSHGPLAGLLMGLGQLQCSEIRLKKIYNRQGILGVDRLINFLLQEWLQDIKKRQLPKILGGVGPMYSLVQLFQGIFDLFYLPFEQYQKDGRIVRGIQRGAQSFTARTALAALEITSRIIYLLQITAETAYDMVSPGPSVRRRIKSRGKRKRINPPQDIREGMANAYYIVKDGIGDTAQTIMQMAALEHDQKGYTGAVGAVMRQIPPTVVRPIVLATQASNQVLGGLTNQLIPDARIEAKEKWKDENDN